MRYVYLIGLYVLLVAFTVTDALNHPDRSPYGLHKIMWVIVIVLVPYIGAIAWLLFKFREGGSRSAGHTTVAPDDDPEYLSWLAQQERRRKQQGG